MRGVNKEQRPSGRVKHGSLTEGAALLLFAAFLGLSCNSGSEPKDTIEIGYVGGLSGGDYSGRGLPNEAGAEFAVERTGSVRGFPLKFVARDDTEMGAYSGNKGEEVVRQLISDSKVLGVVGPLRSPVAWQVTAAANIAHLAIISPTNTYPCMTLVRDYCQVNSLQLAVAMRPTGKNNYSGSRHLRFTLDQRWPTSRTTHWDYGRSQSGTTASLVEEWWRLTVSQPNSPRPAARSSPV